MKKFVIVLSALVLSSFVLKAEQIFASVQTAYCVGTYWKNQSEQQRLMGVKMEIEKGAQLAQQESSVLLQQGKELKESLENPAYSEEKKEEIKGQIEALGAQLAQKEREFQMIQAQFQREVQKVEMTLVNDVKAVIQEIAEEKGIDVVIDSLPYCKIDLTEEVVAKLAESAPAAAPAAQ